MKPRKLNDVILNGLDGGYGFAVATPAKDDPPVANATPSVHLSTLRSRREPSGGVVLRFESDGKTLYVLIDGEQEARSLATLLENAADKLAFEKKLHADACVGAEMAGRE